MKLGIIIILSFLIYLFPIAFIGEFTPWGLVLWSVWTTTMIGSGMMSIFLFTIFAMTYQLLLIYCFYKVSKLPFAKCIAQGILIVIIFYLVLLGSVYLLSGMSTELDMLLRLIRDE